MSERPRSSTFALLGASSMPLTNRLMNQDSEYWYMGSTMARSEMQKKSSDARSATGRYSSRVSSICFSVTSASATLALISLDVTWCEGEVEGARA